MLHHRLTLIILLSGFAWIIHAQDKVGIGTTTPTHKLTILSADSNVVRLLGPGDFESKARLTFGDVDRVFIEEDIDDRLQIYGLNRTALMGGNVGIGTLDPDTKLHVLGGPAGSVFPFSGSVLTLENSHNAYLSFLVPDGNESGLLFGNPIGGNTEGGIIYDHLNLNRLDFRTNGNVTRMVIDGTGQVGIGTDAPQAKLEVRNNFKTVLLEPVTSGFSVFQEFNNADGLRGIVGADGFGLSGTPDQFTIATWSNHPIKFFINQAEKMAISNTGKVGIGISAAAEMLHIYANDDPTLLLQSNGLSEMSGKVAMRQSNFTGADIYYDGLSDELVFETFTGGASEGRMMVMQLDGDIGIGTTSAAISDMAAGYRLSVNGKIAATEVRVQPTADWPDYVFMPDYELMPLEELQCSIEAEGHLPGIPSAVQVEQEGIMVGDMQTRMLEKIEELTLYILDMNQEIEALKEENEAQAIEISQLRNH